MFKNLPNRKLKFRHKMLDLSVPKVMGVLNVTPDSFSDGGRFNGVDKALAHCQEMINYGVDIIDIGGESTRPNATPVGIDEELRRVVPVVEAIRAKFGDELWLSLDTSTPEVMGAGIMAGADMVNDVRALRRDGAMQMVAQLGCPVVLMHSRGEPDTMDKLAVYHDVLAQVTGELEVAVERAIKAGIDRDNMIIDVGMGFAKNHQHHVCLIKHLGELIDHFGLPMLFGVSRKRFLAEVLASSGLDYLKNHVPSDRDMVGVSAHLLAICQGVSMVRVHDVKHMVQAVKLYESLT